MNKLNRIIPFILVVCAILNYAVADSVPADKPKEQTDPIALTLDQCMLMAMENSLVLKSMLCQIDRQELESKLTNKQLGKLKKGKRSLEDGIDSIGDEISKLREQERALIQKRDSLGLTPEEEAALAQLQQGIEQYYSFFISMSEQSDKASTKANEGITEALGFKTERKFKIEETIDLMQAMYDVSLDLLRTGYKAAMKQIALLVEQRFYDVVSAEKAQRAKNIALQRAEKQLETAEALYKEGFVALDDVLMCRVQVGAIHSEFALAQANVNNAKLDLNSAIGLPLEQTITLSEPSMSNVESIDMAQGIEQGLVKRQEILEALGQMHIADLNFELITKKYKESSDQYKESKLYRDWANAECERIKLEVEVDIRKSYEQLLVAEKAYQYLCNSEGYARQRLANTVARYEESFLGGSIDKLTGGTIVDVLTAQENLASIEEAVVIAEFNKNLAYRKYLLAIGEYEMNMGGEQQ